MFVEKHKDVRRLRNGRNFEELNIVGVILVKRRTGRVAPASPTIAFIE